MQVSVVCHAQLGPTAATPTPIRGGYVKSPSAETPPAARPVSESARPASLPPRLSSPREPSTAIP
eukprot:6070910-Prymnesium_polylepis.1